MDKNEGWVTVSHKKNKKYKPPYKIIKNFKNIQIVNNINFALKKANEKKYINKYLEGQYFNSNKIPLYKDSSFKLFHNEDYNNSIKLKNSVEYLKNCLINEKYNNVNENINNIKNILNFTKKHMPQNIWEKEFYNGNIYNNKGIKYSEIIRSNYN